MLPDFTGITRVQSVLQNVYLLIKPPSSLNILEAPVSRHPASGGHKRPMTLRMMVVMTWPLHWRHWGGGAPGAILSHTETWSQAMYSSIFPHLFITTQAPYDYISHINIKQNQKIFLGLLSQRTKKVRKRDVKLLKKSIFGMLINSNEEKRCFTIIKVFWRSTLSVNVCVFIP